MGNCSAPAAKGTPDAPVPKLDAKKLGLNRQEVNASDAFSAMKSLYEAKRKALTEDDKRSAEDKKPENIHKDAFADPKVQEKADDIVQYLDKKLDLTKKAKQAQDEGLEAMGDDNPEKDIPSVGKGAWEKAKKAACAKAVKEVCKKAISTAIDPASKKEEAAEGEASPAEATV